MATTLIFDPAENHVIRAGNEELVFAGFLRGVPGMPSDKVGSTLAPATWSNDYGRGVGSL